MPSLEQNEYLLSKYWREFVLNKLGAEQWITVCRSERTGFEHVSFFCALVPFNHVEQTLESTDWDLDFSEGFPGCNVSGYKEEKVVEYFRFGKLNGIEPLVFFRDFYGVKENYVELSEEFRHFHNLFFDRKDNTFIKIYDSGEEEQVAMIEGETVRVKLKQLRQFLAMKEMVLAVFFTIDRHTTESLQELGLVEETIEEKHSDCTYYFIVRPWNHGDNYQTHSRFMGKRIIKGYPKEKCGIWPYEEEKRYIDFIIGQDQNNEPVYFTSDPDLLANYFGANPNAPHYLTPVFFSRDVLRKYIDQPEKYSVEDGYLRCSGLWGVQIDNNMPESVSVFLGDLGRDMPYHDQLYWRSFNILPNGKISDVNFKRSFLAEFTDPEQIDLVLKSKYLRIQREWSEKYGWTLFESLNEGDLHYFETLRLPLTNDQSEFDKQILSLAKILIESISVENIQMLLKTSQETKPITSLEMLFEHWNIKGFQLHTKFLRKLYELRSAGIGHRKGENYFKVARYFGIEEDNLIPVMKNIMNEVISFLDLLSEQCLQTQE